MGLEFCVPGFVGDQDSLQQAGEVAVVADRVVHRGPVVPERDRPGTPAEPDLELGLAVLVVHDREQFPALRPAEPDDPRVLGEVDEEDLLAGLASASRPGRLARSLRSSRLLLHAVGVQLGQQAGDAGDWSVWHGEPCSRTRGNPISYYGYRFSRVYRSEWSHGL